MLNRFFCLLALALLLTASLPDACRAALKIGVLPASDSLALHVAKDEGLFAAQGLEVELVPFQSALEQAAAIRAGAMQGWFTDIITVLLMHESGVPQSIVATMAQSGPGGRFFGIAVPPDSKASSARDLQGASVAISQATIIEYMLDSMLAAQGLGRDAAQRVDIKQISVRMQLLMAGKADAAVLPEPLLSLMEARGARVILDNTMLNEPLAVTALRRDAARPEDVRAFRAALAEAMRRINADPEAYKKVMLAKKLLPADAEQRYTMLRYDPDHCPTPLPSEADLERVAAWMLANKLLRKAPVVKDVLYDGGRE